MYVLVEDVFWNTSFVVRYFYEIIGFKQTFFNFICIFSNKYVDKNSKIVICGKENI